jgi:outer membrane protein TolC
MITGEIKAMSVKKLRNPLRLIAMVSLLLFAGGLAPAQDKILPVQMQTVRWDEIRTLDLKQAAKIALINNPTLAAADARVQQARERLQQARARYWPSLDATLAGARISYAENNPNFLGDDPEKRFQTALSATWVLFDGFSRKFSNAAAFYGQSQSESAQNEARRLILSAVAASYFAAQLALEDIAVAGADETFNLRQLVEADARHKIGTGSLSDVLNFKIRANEAKTRLINAERVFEETLFALAALLGAPESHFPAGMGLARLKQETADEMAPPDPDMLASYAMTHRPDIQESQFALKQAGAQVKVAKSRFYPAINLAASADGLRRDDIAFEQDDFGNTIGINLTYNLFAGGYDRARTRELRAREVELQKSLEELRLRASSEVRISSTQVITTQRQMILQRANTELNQQNRDLVEKEYAAGQVSLVRLNEAQRDLTTAQSRLALALASLRQAWFNLETDSGRILEILPEK